MKRAGARKGFDVVLLEEVANPVGQILDDLVFAGEHRRKVERQAVEADSVLLESLLGEMIELARIEHGLAGDTAYVQAGSTQGRALFNACDLHSELRRPDCRDVTTGAGPDDHQVEL